MNLEVKRRIDLSNDPQGVRLFFKLLKLIIDKASLSATDERLGINIRNDHHKRYFSAVINNRLFLFLKAGKQIGIMLNKSDMDSIANIPIEKVEEFEKQTPQGVLVYFKHEVLSEHLDIILPLWYKACLEYLPQQRKSQYRNKHIPELYEIATQDSLLEKYLGPIDYGQYNSTDNVDVKEAFINWFIGKDGRENNYFTLQFGASRERLKAEMDNYELIYKNEFGSNLFLVSPSNFETRAEEIRTNVYGEDSEFSKFSKDSSNHRPRAILGKRNYIKFLKEYFSKNNNSEAGLIKQQAGKHPLNQILYGPPGTGKTYNTIQKALEILGEDMKGKTRTELKKIFDQKTLDGQIAFTTFHQSMSYEDFIEGIKPVTRNERVTYHVEDGIFKQLVKKALIEYLQNNTDSENEDTFDALFNEYVESLRAQVGQRKATFTTKTGVELMLVDTTENALLVKYVWRDRKKEQEGKQVFTISREKLKKVLSENVIPEKIKNLKEQLHPLIGHIHCELFAVYKDFYSYVLNKKGQIETVAFDYKDLDFDEVKEQFELVDLKKINEDEIKPYVLIIDEINRGNVSQIFGELITLLEADKRLGEEEKVILDLPYSKSKFGIPKNLYIIGTMNTADRSVEALDTALRRRFSFKEILPEPELLQGIEFNGFNLAEVLTVINQRIEALLDRDHTIGHSYFIKIASHDIAALANAFTNCILPLLQEYFYGDYEKIALVLGKGFVGRKPMTEFSFAAFDDLEVPEPRAQFELIQDIEDIEEAVRLLLNRYGS